MKKLITIATIAALAACSPAKTEAPAEDAVAEAPAAEAPMAPDGQPGPGTYDVTYADGTKGATTLTAEGTFSSVVGDVTTAGAVRNMDGKTCFDPAGDDTPEVCWTDSAAAADGSWTATNEAGETVTVKRVVS